LPESLKALDSWLTDVGLDELLEIIEFADLQNPQRGLPRANQRLATFAAQVASYKARSSEPDPESYYEQEKRLTKQIAAGENIHWPTGLKETERPRFIILFRPKQGGDEFDATENAFLKAHKVSLWIRIFQKISALEGISARSIVAYVPVWCSANLVYLDAGHDAYRHGSVCTSASSSVPLGTTVKVASGATPWFRFGFTSSAESLSDAVRTVISSLTSAGGAGLDFLSTESDFVEVTVRGIRGQVIRGGRDWERLQITAAITGGGNNNRRTLRVTVDGRVASGLGGYPPDSQFTRDMEPQYSMNLTEYTKRLANALRDRLTQQ